MKEHQIHIQETDKKGKAYVGNMESPLAAMTFSKAGDSLIIIDHTEVDESLRGEGIGRKMLDKIVSIARERGIKIMPLCPYAKSIFDKDESIRDILR